MRVRFALLGEIAGVMITSKWLLVGDITRSLHCGTWLSIKYKPDWQQENSIGDVPLQMI